jgi:hypothetical protein
MEVGSPPKLFARLARFGRVDVGRNVKALQRPRYRGVTVSGALFVTSLAATRIDGVVTTVTPSC